MENAAGVACLDGGSTPPGSTILCITCDSFLIAGAGFRRKLAPTEPRDPCVPHAACSGVLQHRAVFPDGSIHGSDDTMHIRYRARPVRKHPDEIVVGMLCRWGGLQVELGTGVRMPAKVWDAYKQELKRTVRDGQWKALETKLQLRAL